MRRAARILGRLLLATLALSPLPAFADPISLQATPIELLPGHPATTVVGRLAYLGGLHVTSGDARFGGVSGLETLADGRLVAVTDLGYWLTFRPVRDTGGRLVGIADGDLEPLRDDQGRAFDEKALADAESVRRDAQGRLLVSFERNHRVLRYDRVGGNGVAVQTPDNLAGQPANGGIEALAAWPASAGQPDGRLLLISERGRNPDGDLRAWLRDKDGWHALGYPTQGESLPTDAAILPAGDLLVLERQYGLFTEQGARLVLIPQARVAPGAQLSGETLAAWRKPYSVDNMEALAVAADPDGATLLWVMSDDNQSASQRTLLMLFRME